MLGWEYMHSAWWGVMFLGILMAVTLILLLIFAVMLLRCFTARRHDASLSESPLDILGKRYALVK